MVQQAGAAACGASPEGKKLRYAFILLGLLVCTSCQDVSRLGVVLPETGSAAAYGASLKTGISLALARHRSAGGPPIEVWFRDSGSDPARAASACEALFEQNVTLIIGGATSAEAKAMIGVADRFGRVLLSPSASAPDLARRSTQFFRVYPSDELEGAHAAQFLVQRQGVRAVLVVSENNDYARGLLPVFVASLQALGAQVVGPETIAEPGWETRVRQALGRHGPEGAYVCGYGEAISRALLVLRGAGFRGPICTTSAIHSATLIPTLGQEAERLYFPLATADHSGDGEPARSFISAYRQTYNLEPDVYACYGYDAALASLAVLSSAVSSDAKQVAAGLRALRGLRGVMGLMHFDEVGNIERELQTHWIAGGRVEPASVPRRPDRQGGGS